MLTRGQLTLKLVRDNMKDINNLLENTRLSDNESCNLLNDPDTSINNKENVDFNENSGKIRSRYETGCSNSNKENVDLSENSGEIRSLYDIEKVEKVKRKIFSQASKIYRKKKCNPKEWKRNKAAILRQRGESYISQSGKRMPKKEPNFKMICTQNCKFQCNDKFDSEARTFILNKYYQLDINAKNTLLFKSIKMKVVARHRVNVVKPKKYSFTYWITYKQKETRVCQKAMCSLYQFSKKKIEQIQNKLKSGDIAPTPDKRGHHDNRPHKIDEAVRQGIIEHILNFPSESSHYSRNVNLHRKYLSPLLNITKMYNLYIEECSKQKKPDIFFIQKCTYYNIFSRNFNLAFGHPKSDTCSICDAGAFTKEHKENYTMAFEQQRKDKAKVRTESNTLYLTMDLQQTMPLPRLTTSKCFYLRQMWFYNFGIHTVSASGEKAFFFTWTEDVANRGSAEIISSLNYFVYLLQNNPYFSPSIEHLIIWSDSCGGQNKNFNMICFYQYLILKGIFKSIDHKFPEVGHSYLDSDRNFGRIEKALRKHEKIQLPDEYRDIIKESSPKNAVVTNMTHRFKKVEDLSSKMHLYNKKKNVLKEKIYFRDSIKWIRTETYGSYLYKTSLDENTPFLKVDILKRNSKKLESGAITLDRVISETGNLSAEKLSNLRDQIIFVDDEFKWFYEDILANNENFENNVKRRKTN